eukprot:jgi/Ulvmu1/6038/UM027_0014.1
MGKDIAIISTSASELGGGPTGCWAEEIMAPIRMFKAAGHNVSVYSIKGGKIPIDEMSLGDQFRTEDVDKFLSDDSSKSILDTTEAIDALPSPDTLDAVYLPGGHGACADFPENDKLQKFLSAMYEHGKVVSSVCHGPAAFANVKTAAGVSIVKGKKVTGFSNSEEEAVGKTGAVPFLLEDKLKELGGDYRKADADWAEYAVADGNLITGQNPTSSKAVAKLVIDTFA